MLRETQRLHRIKKIPINDKRTLDKASLEFALVEPKKGKQMVTNFNKAASNNKRFFINQSINQSILFRQRGHRDRDMSYNSTIL